MRVKAIKLNGFKSFGEKTTIDFDESLIGIVGPNGSGKSNVIDAIKWVFGEQRSKNLRTTTNTDVIFVGSQNKKPMNFAEVTLIYDNSDNYLEINFKEVAVTRRLYRTGENEYFINNQKCRLKDVTALTLDKGFGKDSFSVISQGKVEEIIMAKPEKRREVVEEVAGILKYKNQKDTAGRKLIRLRENIDKIEFIIEEIRKKLKPLAEASEKAQKFKELSDELRQKEVSVLSFEIATAGEKLENSKVKNIEYQKQEQEYADIYRRLETTARELNQQLEEYRSAEMEISSGILSIKDKLLELRNKVNIISERALVYGGDDVGDRINFLEQKISNTSEALREANVQLSKLVPRSEEKIEKINKLKLQMEEKRKKYQSNKINYSRLIEEQKRSSYPFAVQKVLEEKIQGVTGPVAKLYSIKSGYETAINAVIGNRKNEVVTVDETSAEACIEILKKKRYGRVTFNPLNKIKPRYPRAEDRDAIDNLTLGTGIKFINYDLKYKKLFEMFLGNILVCKDIQQAYKAQRELHGVYQLVTLEGDIVSGNGKLTGGSMKKNNRYEVEDKLSQLKQEIDSYETSEIEVNNEIESEVVQKNELDLEINIVRNFVKKNKEELSLYNAEYAGIQGDDSHTELARFKNEIAELEEKELILLKKQEENLLKMKKTTNAVEDNNERFTEVRSEEKIFNQENNDNNIRMADLKNKMNLAIDKLREDYELTYAASKEFVMSEFDFEEYASDVKELKKEIKDLGFVNLEAVKLYENENKRFEYYTAQKEDLEISREKILKIIEKLDKFVKREFEEAFVKLNDEFKAVFTNLFGGGNAELFLTDPSNLLESGVEILAQPPGKKSQIIGLLSGGEKALTAIALLFAILKIRVIPYAILDEVEAALDEVNVSRYATYLKIFSQKTQFIVITHRQGTMEKMDKLYGVTMPEKGISSVFDINLKENLEGE